MADDENYDVQKWTDDDDDNKSLKSAQKFSPTPPKSPNDPADGIKSLNETKKKKKKRRKKGKSKRKSVDRDELAGESLASCSQKEWETADAAYNPELINLKKKQNRVTVFAKTKKVTKNALATKPAESPNADGLTSLEPEKIKLGAIQPNQYKNEDHADKIGRLVAGIVRKFMDGKNDDDVKIEIKLITSDNHTPVLP